MSLFDIVKKIKLPTFLKKEVEREAKIPKIEEPERKPLEELALEFVKGEPKKPEELIPDAEIFGKGFEDILGKEEQLKTFAPQRTVWGAVKEATMAPFEAIDRQLGKVALDIAAKFAGESLDTVPERTLEQVIRESLPLLPEPFRIEPTSTGGKWLTKYLPIIGGLAPYAGAPKPTKGLPKYKEAILKEIGQMKKLPQIERQVLEWKPDTFTYNNPLTKQLYKAWDKVNRVYSTKAPRVFKSFASKDVEELAKERQRIIDGMTRRYHDEFVKPIEKLPTPEKQQIGLMINKYIGVPKEYVPTIKAVDQEIGRLGKAMVDKNKEWLKEGLITADTAYLSEEVWASNLGEYARTFYLRPPKIPGRPEVLVPKKAVGEGFIETGMFKKKLTLEEWGAQSFEFEQNILDNRFLTRIPYVESKTAQSLVKNKLDTIEKVVNASEEQIAKALPKIMQDKAGKIKEGATTLYVDYKVQEIPYEELRKAGLEAKKTYGWVYQADAMLDKTFKDLTNNYATMQWQDAIVKSPELFSKTPKSGFLSIKTLLPKGVEKDIRLGPLNFGYYNPILEDEIKLFVRYGQDAPSKVLGEVLSNWKSFKVAGNPATVLL